MPAPGRRQGAARAVTTWPVLFVAVLLSLPGQVAAQSLEPRSYTNLPVGMNFAIVGTAYSTGALHFDPSVPLEDASVDTGVFVLGYLRALDLFGKSGTFSVVASYMGIQGDALYLGERVEGENWGPGDPMFRLSINPWGAPALSRDEFQAWTQDVVVGLSLLVQPPWGDYESKVLTAGSNRWMFKPEIGLSKRAGPWQLELAFGTSFFTDNDDPFSGDNLSQDPIHALQVHVIRYLRAGRWLSVDATHYEGGEVDTDGVRSSGLQRSGRYGLTFSTPLGRQGDSVKFYASTGAYSRIGSDFDLVGIAWQRGWGGH